MKKIVSLLICALLIAAFAIPALAADETVFTITADKATAAVGDVITLTVSVSGSDEINAGGIIFTYDSNVFELVLNDKGKPYFEAGNVPPFMTAFDGKGVALMNLMGFAVPEGVAGKIQLRVIAECPSTEFISGSASAKAGTTTFPTTVNGVSISITGEHDFGAWTPNGENHVHTCSKCGAEETGAHKLVKGEVTQQPNCTVEGKQNATCSDCGLTTSVSIPTNDNHSWNAGEITTEPKCGVEGVKTYTCQHNAEHTYTESVPALEHKYDAVVTAPTCTEKGYTTYTCSLCGNSYVDTYVDATGHKMGQWVVVTDSTCTAVGEERSDCSACDHFETREIPVKAHDYVNAVVTAPTCTEKGFTTHTCVCGDSYVDTYVPATGHKMGDWAVETPATCEATGTDRRDCANCDHFETRTTKALGHDYKSEVTKEATCKDEGVLTYTCQNDASHTYTESIPTNENHVPAEDAEVTKEPTCTEKGEMTGKCEICGKVLDKQELPALGHKWGEWAVTTPATCTAKGVETRECATCHETETKPIDMIPHELVATVTAPTCTAQGFTTYNCKNCDHSEVGEYVKATGHTYDDGVITTAPECEKEGVKTFTCIHGDHSYTEAVPATGHSTANMEVTKEPTCEEDGVMSGKCSVCGKELSNEKIPALGHDFELTEDVAPTCTEKGHKTYVCKNDASHTQTEEIAALGHTFGNWIQVDAENHKHVCACGHEETAKHNWGTGMVTVEPTHTTTGIKTFECECHATREEELPKLDDHDDKGGEPKPIKDEEGNVDKKKHTAVCTCGEEHEEDHSYVFIEIIEKATEGKKGKQLWRCGCGVEDIVTYRVDGTLDNEPGMGDITGQVIMTGVAAFSMIAAAAYVFTRKRTA